MGIEGEHLEGVGVHFDPWAPRVEVIIRGAGFLFGEQMQRGGLVNEVWEVLDFVNSEG